MEVGEVWGECVCVCVFTCACSHVCERRRKRDRPWEAKEWQERDRQRERGWTPPTKAEMCPPPACCGLPIARHLPHYSLHFTACCPLSAAILFVHTILKLAEIAAQPQCLLTQNEWWPRGSVLFWKTCLEIGHCWGETAIPEKQSGEITLLVLDFFHSDSCALHSLVRGEVPPKSAGFIQTLLTRQKASNQWNHLLYWGETRTFLGISETGHTLSTSFPAF